MAYFSNGTEGESYRSRYCERCDNLPEDETKDCPIWTAHLFYAYSEHKNAPVRNILDMLIPMKPHQFKDGLTCDFPAECAFFRLKQERLPL